MTRLSLLPGGRAFLLEGGKHGDPVHDAIMKVPGWRPCKMGEFGTLKAVACYTGPVLPASVAGLKRLCDQFMVVFGDGVGLVLQRVEEAVRVAKTALTSTPCGVHGVGNRALLPHQVQAFFALEAMLGQDGGAILADDMGLGKTTVAMAIAAKFDLPRVVVVCPASVKWNWQREFEATELPLHQWWVYVCDGSARQREANLSALQRSTETWPRVIVTNYDQLGPPVKNETEAPRNQLAEDWRMFLERFVSNGLLVADESHYIKDEKSGRSQAVAAIAKNARYRLLMTGTPIRNTPRDLWHQLEVANQGVWRNVWDFERRYMRTVAVKMGKRRFRKPVGWQNPQELGLISGFHMVRRLKSDLKNLPPKMPPTVHDVEMDDVTAKHYKAMRNWWLYEFADLGDDENVFSPRARSGLEATLRLMQIAQGFVSGAPFEQPTWIAENAKSAWLLEMVQDLLHTCRKPVIWSQFNKPLSILAEMIQARLNVPAIVFTGELDTGARQAALDTFATEEKAVFLGQVKIAEGFNLTTSQDVIFYGRDWSPAVNAQAEDRVHRIGQKGTVSIHVPLVRGTIEKRMHERLAKKTSVNQSVLTMAELRELV